MATAYLTDIISLFAPTTVGSGVTDFPVSREAAISQEIAQNFLSSVVVDSVVVGGGEEVLLKLQHYNGYEWQDVDSVIAVVPITANGTWHIYLDEGVEVEAFVLPLFNKIRFVVTTGATSSCRVMAVTINKNFN